MKYIYNDKEINELSLKDITEKKLIVRVTKKGNLKILKNSYSDLKGKVSYEEVLELINEAKEDESGLDLEEEIQKVKTSFNNFLGTVIDSVSPKINEVLDNASETVESVVETAQSKAEEVFDAFNNTYDIVSTRKDIEELKYIKKIAVKHEVFNTEFLEKIQRKIFILESVLKAYEKGE